MLLYDESPITVSPTLATELGLSEAVLLQQLHYWIEVKRRDFHKHQRSLRDGRWWVYFSTRELAERYPYLGSERTIKTKISELLNAGWLLKSNYNESNIDRTNWYSINYDKITELQNKKQAEINAQIAAHRLDENVQSIGQKLPNRLGRNCPIHSEDFAQPIPKTSSKTSNKENIAHAQLAHPLDENVFELEIREGTQHGSKSQILDPNAPPVPPPIPRAEKLGTGPAFSEFWALYPVKRDRKRAEKVWQAMPAADRVAVLVDVPRRVTGDAQWVAGFRPYPSTYLTGRRWEDELQGAQSVPAAMAAEQQQKAVEQAVAKSEFSTFIETLSVGARLVSTSGKLYAVEYLDPGKQYARAVLDGTRRDLNVTAQNFHLLSLEG